MQSVSMQAVHLPRVVPLLTVPRNSPAGGMASPPTAYNMEAPPDASFPRPLTPTQDDSSSISIAPYKYQAVEHQSAYSPMQPHADPSAGHDASSLLPMNSSIPVAASPFPPSLLQPLITLTPGSQATLPPSNSLESLADIAALSSQPVHVPVQRSDEQESPPIGALPEQPPAILLAPLLQSGGAIATDLEPIICDGCRRVITDVCQHCEDEDESELEDEEEQKESEDHSSTDEESSECDNVLYDRSAHRSVPDGVRRNPPRLQRFTNQLQSPTDTLIPVHHPVPKRFADYRAPRNQSKPRTSKRQKRQPDERSATNRTTSARKQKAEHVESQSSATVQTDYLSDTSFVAAPASPNKSKSNIQRTEVTAEQHATLLHHNFAVLNLNNDDAGYHNRVRSTLSTGGSVVAELVSDLNFVYHYDQRVYARNTLAVSRLLHGNYTFEDINLVNTLMERYLRKHDKAATAVIEAHHTAALEAVAACPVGELSTVDQTSPYMTTSTASSTPAMKPLPSPGDGGPSASSTSGGNAIVQPPYSELQETTDDESFEPETKPVKPPKQRKKRASTWAKWKHRDSEMPIRPRPIHMLYLDDHQSEVTAAVLSRIQLVNKHISRRDLNAEAKRQLYSASPTTRRHYDALRLDKIEEWKVAMRAYYQLRGIDKEPRLKSPGPQSSTSKSKPPRKRTPARSPKQTQTQPARAPVRCSSRRRSTVDYKDDVDDDIEPAYVEVEEEAANYEEQSFDTSIDAVDDEDYVPCNSATDAEEYDQSVDQSVDQSYASPAEEAAVKEEMPVEPEDVQSAAAEAVAKAVRLVASEMAVRSSPLPSLAVLEAATNVVDTPAERAVAAAKAAVEQAAAVKPQQYWLSAFSNIPGLPTA